MILKLLQRMVYLLQNLMETNTLLTLEDEEVLHPILKDIASYIEYITAREERVKSQQK
jgi:hypothetical protein